MKTKFSRFLCVLLTMLMILTITPVMSVVATTASGTDRGTPNGAPAAPMLSHNAWSGESSYDITFNIWWGNNATSYKLYENGNVISSGNLEANSPNGQSQTWHMSGKANGTYNYEIALTNAFGTSKGTTKVIVTGVPLKLQLLLSQLLLWKQLQLRKQQPLRQLPKQQLQLRR